MPVKMRLVGVESVEFWLLVLGLLLFMENPLFIYKGFIYQIIINIGYLYAGNSTKY